MSSGWRETVTGHIAMPDDLDLMRVHVETLFTHDTNGRMRNANEPGGAPAPRFFLGRTAAGDLWRFRRDLDTHAVEALEALCATLPPGGEGDRTEDATPFAEVLAERGPVERIWSGPAFRFPEELAASEDTIQVHESNADVLRPNFEDWLDDVPICQPFVALLRDGAAVSLCCSVRVSRAAHEAGVETALDFRGQGFAPRVVAGWADAVRRIDRIPLYSTSWDNQASLAVANKLGLIRYGNDLHIT